MAEKHGRDGVDVKEAVIRVVRPCPDRSEQERLLDAVRAATEVGVEFVDEQRLRIERVPVTSLLRNYYVPMVGEDESENRPTFAHFPINSRRDFNAFLRLAWWNDPHRFIHDEHVRVDQLTPPTTEVHGARHTGGMNWLSGQGSVVRLGDEIMSLDDFHLIFGVAPLAYYPPTGPLGWNLCAWWGYECCFEVNIDDLFLIPPQHRHPSYNPAKWSDLDRMCITPLWQVEEQSAPLSQVDRFPRNEHMVYRKGAKDAQFAYAHYANAPVMNLYTPGSVKLDMSAWQFDQRRRRVYRRMYYAVADKPLEDSCVRVVTFEPLEEAPEYSEYRAVPVCCRDSSRGLRHVHNPCCMSHFGRFLFGCATPLIKNLSLFEILHRDMHHRQGSLLYSCNEILMEAMATFMCSSGSDILEVIASYFRKEELELFALPLRYFMGCTRNCPQNFGDMLLQCRVYRDFTPGYLIHRQPAVYDLKVITPLGLREVLGPDINVKIGEGETYEMFSMPEMKSGPKIYDRYPRWRVALLSGILNDMNEKRERDMKFINRGFVALRAQLEQALFIIETANYTKIEKTVVPSFPFESRLVGVKGPEPLRRRTAISAASIQEEHEDAHRRLLKAWKFIFDVDHSSGFGRRAIAERWLKENKWKGPDPVHSNDKIFFGQMTEILAGLMKIRIMGSQRKEGFPVTLEGFNVLVFNGAVQSSTYEFGVGELKCSCYQQVGICQGEMQALSWASDRAVADFMHLLDPAKPLRVRGLFEPTRYKVEEGEIKGEDRVREPFTYSRKELLSPWRKKNPNPVDLTEEDSDATVPLAQDPANWELPDDTESWVCPNE